MNVENSAVTDTKQNSYAVNSDLSMRLTSCLLAIFRMLRTETYPITSLDLDEIDLTAFGNTEPQYHHTQLPNTNSVVNLGPVFESSRLKVLSLRRCDFSGDRVLILAECVWVCKSLERLYCWSCSLTSRVITDILEVTVAFTRI